MKVYLYLFGNDLKSDVMTFLINPSNPIEQIGVIEPSDRSPWAFVARFPCDVTIDPGGYEGNQTLNNQISVAVDMLSSVLPRLRRIAGVQHVVISIHATRSSFLDGFSISAKTCGKIALCDSDVEVRFEENAQMIQEAIS